MFVLRCVLNLKNLFYAQSLQAIQLRMRGHDKTFAKVWVDTEGAAHDSTILANVGADGFIRDIHFILFDAALSPQKNLAANHPFIDVYS